MSAAAFTIAIVVPITLFATLRWGVTGTVWALVATNLVASIFWFILGIRVMSVPPKDLFSAVWRSLAALAVMVVVVWLIDDRLSGNAASYYLAFKLGLEIVAGALTYIGTHLALWRLCAAPDGPEKQVIGIVAARLARKSENSIEA